MTIGENRKKDDMSREKKKQVPHDPPPIFKGNQKDPPAFWGVRWSPPKEKTKDEPPLQGEHLPGNPMLLSDT